MKRQALSVPTGMHMMENRRGGSSDALVGMVDKLNSSSHARREVRRLGDWVAPSRKSGTIEYERLADHIDDDHQNGTLASLCVRTFDCIATAMPILRWLPAYDVGAYLLPDMVAGVTLGLICVVQTLAHASIATTNVIQGPYCAFIPPLVYAVMGTSRHASISSGAIVAILLADQLSDFSDMDERTHLASLLSLIAGSVLVLLGLCRAAFLVRFLSQSLISGFVTGGSLLIIEGQVKNLLGITLPHTVGFFGAAWQILLHVQKTNIVGLLLGLTMLMALSLMVDLKKYANKRLEGDGPHPRGLRLAKFLSEMKEIVCVAIGVSFAYATTDSDGSTLIPIVGPIPQGLPEFRAPWDHQSTAHLLKRSPLRLREFFTAGCLLALTSFLTTYATSKKQALTHGYKIDATQDAIALGMAGICGSCFGSFTPSGSLSRTSLASEVGVKTQLNGVILALVVGFGLTFLTPVLYYLPKATLAAIVIKSAWGLRDFDMAHKLWQQWLPHNEGGQRRDFGIWCLAFTFTICFGALYGIGSAVFLGVVMIVYDAATPRTVMLGCVQSVGSVWRDIEVWPEGKTYEGLLVIEFRGPLNYASAEWFQEQMELKREAQNRFSSTSVKVIVLGFGSVHDLDITAIVMLKELLSSWRKVGVSCIIADAKSRVRLLLEKNFAVGNAPLLSQPAFLIGVQDAVDLALRQLSAQGVAQEDDSPATAVRRKAKTSMAGGRFGFTRMTTMDV